MVSKPIPVDNPDWTKLSEILLLAVKGGRRGQKRDRAVTVGI